MKLKSLALIRPHRLSMFLHVKLCVFQFLTIFTFYHSLSHPLYSLHIIRNDQKRPVKRKRSTTSLVASYRLFFYPYKTLLTITAYLDTFPVSSTVYYATPSLCNQGRAARTLLYRIAPRSLTDILGKSVKNRTPSFVDIGSHDPATTRSCFKSV